jgi:hypothetical protein
VDGFPRDELKEPAGDRTPSAQQQERKQRRDSEKSHQICSARGVQESRDPRGIVMRDGVAARGGHEPAGIRFARAGIGALTAVVADPQVLSGYKPVGETHLRVPDKFAGERISEQAGKKDRAITCSVRRANLFGAVFCARSPLPESV